MLQGVPSSTSASRPSLTVVTAKVMQREIVKAGEQGWLTLIREPKIEGKGLLATVSGTQDSKLPAAIDSLLQEYVDMFEKPGAQELQYIQHQIQLLDENKEFPRPRQYRMMSAEYAEVHG